MSSEYMSTGYHDDSPTRNGPDRPSEREYVRFLNTPILGGSIHLSHSNNIDTEIDTACLLYYQ